MREREEWFRSTAFEFHGSSQFFLLLKINPIHAFNSLFPLSVAVTVVCLCPLSLLNHGYRAEKMFVSWFLAIRWLAHGMVQLCRSFTTLSPVLSPVRLKLSSFWYCPCQLTFPLSTTRRVRNLDFLPSRYAIPDTPDTRPHTRDNHNSRVHVLPLHRCRQDPYAARYRQVSRSNSHPTRPVPREEIELTLVVCSSLEVSGLSSLKKGACPSSILDPLFSCLISYAWFVGLDDCTEVRAILRGFWI